MQCRLYLPALVSCLLLLVAPLEAFEFRPDFSSTSHESRIHSQIELLSYAVPEDAQNELKIGFSEFSSDREGDRLASTLPLQILQGLPEQLPSRTLSDEEVRAIQQRLLTAQRSTAIRELNSSRNRLDELLFSLDSVTERQRKRGDLQAELSRRSDRLGLIESLPLSIIAVNREKTLQLAVPRDRQLHPHFQETIPGDLNILVNGEVGRIGDYVEIIIRLNFSEPENMTREIFRDIVHQDEVFALIPEMQFALIQSLARRDIGMVHILADNIGNSALYIGAERTAVDPSQPFFREPGQLSLVLISPYGSVVRSSFTITAGIQYLELETPELPKALVTLDVEPYGVSVYRSGVFLGRTAMNLPDFDTSQLISLQRDGYRERVFLLTSDTENVQESLQRDTFSLDEEVRNSRDDFYHALGMFALSVPLWVLSTASMSQVMAIFHHADSTGALDSSMFFWGNAIFYSNMTFRIVSIGLGVNAGVHLARYIRFAQAEHTGRY